MQAEGMQGEAEVVLGASGSFGEIAQGEAPAKGELGKPSATAPGLAQRIRQRCSWGSELFSAVVMTGCLGDVSLEK